VLFFRGFEKRAAKKAEKNSEGFFQGLKEKTKNVFKKHVVKPARRLDKKIEERKITPKQMLQTSAAAGFGAGALGAIGDKAREVFKERKVEVSKSSRGFKNKLQPGDVIFEGLSSPPPKNPTLKQRVDRANFNLAIHGTGGTKTYHAGVYLGKGKVLEALGNGKKLSVTDFYTTKGKHYAVAYRPKNFKPEDVKKLKEVTKQLKGKPYYSPGALAARIAGGLVGAPIKPSVKSNSLVCIDVPAAVHPKIFGNTNKSTLEVKLNRKLTPAARIGDIGFREADIKRQHRFVYPTMRGVRGAAKATILAGGAMAAHKMFKKYVSQKDT